MNRASFSLLSLTVCAALFSKAAGMGTNSGGGGNIPRSTAEAVHSAISQVKQNALEYLKDEQYSIRSSTFRVDDKELENVVTAFFGPRAPDNRNYLDSRQFPVAKLILEQKPFEIRETGACDSEDGERDASTAYEPKASVCFSVEALTRLSPASLKDELLALYFHELAHQFSFGESAAKKAQNFIRSRIQTTRIFRDVRKLLVMYPKESSQIKRCFLLGELAGKALTLNLSRDRKLSLTWLKRQEMSFLLNRPLDLNWRSNPDLSITPVDMFKEVLPRACASPQLTVDMTNAIECAVNQILSEI